MLIQSAGRVLSQNNTSRLKALFTEIGAVLVDANVLSRDDLKRILDQELGGLADEESQETGIEAGKFADFLASKTWQQAISTALDAFRCQFLDLYQMSDAQILQIYGADRERKAIALELLTDINAFLQSKIDDYPGFSDNTRIIPSPYISQGAFYASAKTDASTTPQEVDETQEIKAAIPITEKEIDLTFKCELNEVVSAAVSAAAQQQIPKTLANKVPIEGILYYVDEVSEFAPSKGSPLPLYVPRDVAILAAQAINSSGGLPLDADDTLDRHANEEIVGIMTSAEIIGNEFWVKGHLFPWNKQKKVSLIAANSKILGMSMNAHAKTVPMVIDGQRVTCVTSLDILGANILYAEKATYQKTRTVMANQLIAASNNEESGEDMSNLTGQFIAINDTLGALAKDNQKYGEILLQMEKRMAKQDEIIAVFLSEKDEQQKTVAASAAQESKRMEQETLIAAMSKVFAEKQEALKAEIIESLGSRRRPPARVTGGLVDIVAQGSPTGNLSPTHLDLLDAKSRLAALAENGIVGPGRAKLIERVRELESQLTS